MRLTVLFIGLALLANTAFAQQVYRWVDAEGVVHYSDQPPENQRDEAEVVALDANKSSSDQRRPASRSAIGQAQRRGSADIEPVVRASDEPIAYQQVVILKPEAEQVLWNLATRLPVQVEVTPSLASAHRIQYLLDNEPIGEPATTEATVILQPVYRGEHTLIATIIDPDGNTLFRSPPTRFYVQQASIAR